MRKTRRPLSLNLKKPQSSHIGILWKKSKKTTKMKIIICPQFLRRERQNKSSKRPWLRISIRCSKMRRSCSKSNQKWFQKKNQKAKTIKRTIQRNFRTWLRLSRRIQKRLLKRLGIHNNWMKLISSWKITSSTRNGWPPKSNRSKIRTKRRSMRRMRREVKKWMNTKLNITLDLKNLGGLKLNSIPGRSKTLFGKRWRADVNREKRKKRRRNRKKKRLDCRLKREKKN